MAPGAVMQPGVLRPGEPSCRARRASSAADLGLGRVDAAPSSVKSIVVATVPSRCIGCRTVVSGGLLAGGLGDVVEADDG